MQAPNRHASYFLRFLQLLPARLASNDSTRVMLSFFSVSGLDVMNRMDMLNEYMRKAIIDWIYSLQLVPTDDLGRSGIQGSSMLNIADDCPESNLNEYKFGHLAMTYTGLSVLLALGDDFSRLDKKAIVKGVASVQQEDGSFSATLLGNENDMRFVYCAACICSILDDWTGVDIDKMVDYIKRSVRYDAGISQHEEMESHGGTTFCALATLDLCGRLTDLPSRTIEAMKRWLIFRQSEGFNGRPNKPIDTCYSFWIGAALKILGAFELTDFEENRKYILLAENATGGGFSKWPGTRSDPYHTYFSLCALSFLQEDSLLPVMPSLNISMRAYEYMKELHIKWKKN